MLIPKKHGISGGVEPSPNDHLTPLQLRWKSPRAQSYPSENRESKANGLLQCPHVSTILGLCETRAVNQIITYHHRVPHLWELPQIDEWLKEKNTGKLHNVIGESMVSRRFALKPVP